MDERNVQLVEVKGLVGSLLTVIESMFPDKIQREAAKIIVKQTVFRWFNREEQKG